MAEAGGKSGGFGDLALRSASALVLIIVAFAAFWAGGPWSTLLVALAAALMTHEARAMIHRAIGAPPPGAHILAVIAAAFAAEYADPTTALTALAAFAAAGAVFDRMSGRGWALSLAVTLYLGFAAIMLVVLRSDPAHGFLTVLWLLAVVIATDTGAYFTGRALAGPKLWPAVSPGKTWSGLAGGALAAALASTAVAGGASGAISPALAALGAVTACVAQGGDLAESALKRRFGVKDSGALIPGHGGVFDRLDGVVAAAIFIGLITILRGGAPIVSPLTSW